MSLPIRMILILTVVLAIPTALFAQETQIQTRPTEPADTPTTATAGSETAEPATENETTTAGVSTKTSQEIRNDFSRLLRQSPPELASILVLDPTLLSNEGFLTGYPDLAGFVETHPEVRRNPRFYLGHFETRTPRRSVLHDVLEGLSILATIGLIAFALGWFIRTVNDQKRWNRLFRTQNEVHNKILDRFGSTEELLAYIRTPAGSRFLEAAPIPLHA
ncbi:MAG TPA: hypothetical protein VMS12_06705, partial [Thermoanaerobaculia bacterium]|nr:hypothetical protein [Thermoanaerobaculia bacterium]